MRQTLPTVPSARTLQCARVSGHNPVHGRKTVRPVKTHSAVTQEVMLWTGSDEFTALGDRKDECPLPLPELDTPKRVVLVRHGQSTWNAEGRIQGSSDFSVLTAKGQAQAETTRQMVGTEAFDKLFHSPLQRAAETATIIWGDRQGPVSVLPSLREIDLYSFQGLLKQQGKDQFGDVFKSWQKRAAEFEIDGQAPVRELWYRASLAWRQILNTPDECNSLLVVAHNAVNQALVATALGLPPTFFRRLLQSNAAVTVLDLQPTLSVNPKVTVDRLNQSPDRPFGGDGAGRRPMSRIVLVRHCATVSTDEGLMLGTLDEALNTKGEVHAFKTAELLMDMRIDVLVSSPLLRASTTARSIARLQELAGHPIPEVEILPGLNNVDVGSWAGAPLIEVRGQDLPVEAEPLSSVWERTQQAWAHLTSEAAPAADSAEGGRNVVVVAHAYIISALLCHCLGLGQQAVSWFRKDPGGVTILDFPDGHDGPGVVRCINYTAHLGRWAVPITREDLDVCGVDGCF